MTIKRKMTMLISSMLMLIVLLSIVFIYNESSNLLKVEAEEFMASQLDRANENVALLLKTIVLETEKLSLEDNVSRYFDGTLSQDDSDTYLAALMSEKNEEKLLYFDLFLMDHEGYIVSAAMKEAVGVNVGSRTYFRRAVEEQITNTSDIILSRADKTQIVITIAPTYNNDGETIGYTGVAIYATYFSNFLNNFDSSDDSDYIIVDSFDHIVSHPNKKMISSKFSYFGLGKERLKSENTIVYNNETYRILSKDLGFNNWRIISYLKYDDIYSESMKLAYSFMKLAVIAIFIAVGFGIYLTDFISRPIIAITESLNRMLEDEEEFQHRMVHQLPLGSLEDVNDLDVIGLEPTEVSNFRKAIIGFRSALEQGAHNFDVEYNKLQHYIDGLYKELENINKRNLEFIATLSHDIRTPLTLIKGYARGLESGEVKDEEMRSKFQSGIVKSVDDIEHLVYNVLDFAYEVNHSAAYDLKAYTVDVVIREVVFELQQLYEDEKDRMVFDVDTNGYDNKVLLLDLMNIMRVLTNLINNSIKYTAPTDEIKIVLTCSQNGMTFAIYDEGVGIHEEEIDQIFDLFYRTEASKEVKGYGLGLYISQQILKAHQSVLRCTSQVGGSTTMAFDLRYENDLKL